MRFLALVYGDERAWNALAADEKQAVYAEYRAFAAEAGVRLVDGGETAASDAATTVRVRDGQQQVTDGPYAETREQLGGFFVFECDSMDDAVDLAKKIPAPSRGAVVVQPAYVEEAA